MSRYVQDESTRTWSGCSFSLWDSAYSNGPRMLCIRLERVGIQSRCHDSDPVPSYALNFSTSTRPTKLSFVIVVASFLFLFAEQSSGNSRPHQSRTGKSIENSRGS